MILFSAVYKFQDRLSKNLAAFRMPPQEERGLPNILLTTVCRPFGGPGEGDSVGAELFHAQVTREQGIFSYRQVIRCWGLDYIAENIQAPTVVLHYPSEREFVRELKSHPYDYVGINFVVATFNKVKRMAGLIRRHSPKAKIILGGYGTVLNDEQLYPLGDHFCREEGVGFMRRLLSEDVTQPIRHPYAPIESPRLYSYARGTKVAHLTGGLGCPNGCDFCCTSHFFNRQYVPFIQSGSELYDVILHMEQESKRAGDNLNGFIIIDEDFFTQTKRAREFLKCVRENGKQLLGFGSVRSLSQFTADEIAEMGFDIVWTAVEGTESGYNKLRGKPVSELYTSLKSRGVAILSSMIIGFPYQDREQVLKEFRRFTELGPALWQILIYFAFPRTPFYRRAIAENLYLPEYREDPDYRTFDGFSMHFKHPHFSPDEIEQLQHDLYRKSFELLGPSLVRVIRTWFEGYRNLKVSSNPLLRGRADRLATEVRSAVAGIYPAILFGPNRERRAEAHAFLREIERDMGNLTVKERLLCWATVPFSLWTWFANHLNFFQQPKLLRTQHR
jgi:haloalkane dehalogenase